MLITCVPELGTSFNLDISLRTTLTKVISILAFFRDKLYSQDEPEKCREAPARFGRFEDELADDLSDISDDIFFDDEEARRMEEQRNDLFRRDGMLQNQQEHEDENPQEIIDLCSSDSGSAMSVARSLPADNRVPENNERVNDIELMNRYLTACENAQLGIISDYLGKSLINWF